MQDDYNKAIHALHLIPPEDRTEWVNCAMSLKSEFGESAFDEWDNWSRQSDKYKAADARSVWKSIRKGNIGLGTLFHIAEQYGYQHEKTGTQPNRQQIEACRQAAARQREEERINELQRRNNAAEKARALWDRAEPVTEHPYLTRKNVFSYGLRMAHWDKYEKIEGIWRKRTIKNCLLVPMLDLDAKLWNVQAIFPAQDEALGRDKDFLRGARKIGLCYIIGNPTYTLMIAEGYATASTLHHKTGQQVAIAFDCGNIKHVAMAIRQRQPSKRIIICADNDRHTTGNPGLSKATEAALAIGALVSVPQFNDGEMGTDWNDRENLKALA